MLAEAASGSGGWGQGVRPCSLGAPCGAVGTGSPRVMCYPLSGADGAGVWRSCRLQFCAGISSSAGLLLNGIFFPNAVIIAIQILITQSR